MPRILIAATVPATFEAFLTPYSRHFRQLGWRVDGMAAGLSRSRAAADFDRVWDVAWSRNPLDVAGMRELSRIRSIVERERYDVVHVHTPVAAFLTRLALRHRPAGVRVVYTAHGFHFADGLPASQNAAFIALEKLAGRWTDALVVINHDDLEAACRHRILPRERIRLMHGIGVDTARFSRSQIAGDDIDRIRDGLGLHPSVPLLVMVAELNANKRQSLVLEAIARTRMPVHLALAGAGPLREDLQRRVASMGLEQRVHLLGWREDVAVLLAASLGCVLFSAREGLPRSVMEALALEVPVIGADIRGVRELLADGCGLLVPSGDVRALAAAIDALADDPALAAAMGRRGRRKMVGDYSLSAVIGEHEQLYHDVLALQPSRRLVV